MFTVEDVYGPASDLYWIAFLLTARAELSCNLIMEVLDAENGPELVSSPETLPQVRRKVIARALMAMRDEVAASSRQTALEQSDQPIMPIPRWSLGQRLSKTQLEKALVAIDVFPRCALLLAVFEGLHMDDAAKLLHCNRELVCRGRVSGLWQLTRNIGSIASAVPLPLERQGRTGVIALS